MTANEITNGILNANNLENNVLYFEREIESIEDHLKVSGDKSKIGKYIDLVNNSELNEESKKWLNDLKQKIALTKLPAENTVKLKVSFNFRWVNSTIT